MKEIVLQAAYFTRCLEQARTTYKYSERSLNEQALFDQAFQEGWEASKAHTFEILESIALEGEDNGKQ